MLPREGEKQDFSFWKAIEIFTGIRLFDWPEDHYVARRDSLFALTCLAVVSKSGSYPTRKDQLVSHAAPA
jgi:hypothetical protein